MRARVVSTVCIVGINQFGRIRARGVKVRPRTDWKETVSGEMGRVVKGRLRPLPKEKIKKRARTIGLRGGRGGRRGKRFPSNVRTRGINIQ